MMNRSSKSLYIAMLVLLLAGLSMPATGQFWKKDKGDATRLLTGKVLDHSDSPLPNAVVYLTDTRTRAVKTYIVNDQGTYRFPALQRGVDYEVYAQLNGKKSDTKTVSQFDDRSEVNIVLKISTGK